MWFLFTLRFRNSHRICQQGTCVQRSLIHWKNKVWSKVKRLRTKWGEKHRLVVLILICFIQLRTGQTVCSMHQHYYVCFPTKVLCGRLSKYPIDIPSPLCSMLSHEPTVRQCAASYAILVTANQTIFPIIFAATGACYIQRGACFLELDRAEVRRFHISSKLHHLENCK